MDGETGYKYIRATFSNALSSLSEADIEIRDVKTGQLYSVEKVALSTDGLTADITIAGDASVSGTTFLQPSTIYSCKIDADGARSTLEFQLPNIYADVMVASVDTEKNTISVFGSVRKGGQTLARTTTFNVGDSYDENLGELVGRTLVIGVDADNNITSLKVNDGELVFDYLTAKDGDSDNDFDSSKDYFETASGDKYYLSNSYTSAANYTYVIDADNSGDWTSITNNTIAKGETFEYGKLILNPNGTVSAAVVWNAFDDHIIATEADGSVAKETSNNSKDFKGYTVIDGFTFEYRDPKSLEDGDIIYYDSDDKLAFIYNESVTGDLENIYEDKLDIDGTKYNFIVWVTNSADGDIAKQAEYYDADNDEYKVVTEKWAKTLDTTEPVTIYLDTKGDGVLVEGTIGETVTHTKDYIITKSPKAYINGLDYMMDMSVSDGTEVTLHINAADITSIGDDAFGDVEFTDTSANGYDGGTYNFTIDDNDGKVTVGDKKNAADATAPAKGDTPVASTDFQQGGLVRVTYDEDETKVTGLKIILGAQVAGIQMKADKDVSLTAGLGSIKTQTGSLNLTDSTKVYVITGTQMKVGETPHNGITVPYDDTTTNGYKEATDNKVKVYDYADYDLATQAGNALLQKYDTNATKKVDSTVKVNTRIRFVADKTTATAIVIDNRGINNSQDAGVAKDVLGAALGDGDIVGGGVFKDSETITKILGVATGTEYQLNSDGETEQLASIDILTVNGTVSLDDIKAKTDTEKDAKTKIVLAELDSTGKLTTLNEFNPETSTADVDQVNFGRKIASTSTDTLTVTSTAATYSVKADTDCLVVKYDGTKFSETSIGEINRDTAYKAIKFLTSQLNGTNVKAKVIVALKDATGAGYQPVATYAGSATGVLTAGTLTASYDPAAAPALTVATANKAYDQYSTLYAGTDAGVAIQLYTDTNLETTAGTRKVTFTVTTGTISAALDTGALAAGTYYCEFLNTKYTLTVAPATLTFAQINVKSNIDLTAPTGYTADSAATPLLAATVTTAEYTGSAAATAQKIEIELSSADTTITVSDAGTGTLANTKYSLSGTKLTVTEPAGYTGGDLAGTVLLTVTGTGNYTGSVNITVTVTDAA